MKKHSLRIKEHANPFCYLVESESRPQEPYFVDLTQREGHGSCNCTHFSVTARPNHRKHGKFIPYRTDAQGKVRQGVSECKHISACRNFYHMTVTQPMLAKFKGE